MIRKKYMRGFFVCVFLFLFLFLCSCTKKATEVSGNIKTKEVIREDLVVGLSVDGTVALPVTNLNFEVEGLVKTVHTSAGASVQKGDLLVELDDSDYLLSIETAENNLTKAKANYADALWQYESGLKNDALSLKNNKNALAQGFDGFDYEGAVRDAKATLEKRQKELAEAEEKNQTPYDPKSYDRQISDAKKTLSTRTQELYDANAHLLIPFDGTSYDRQISDATKDLEKKQESFNQLKAAGEEDTSSAQEALSSAKEKLKRLEEDRASAKTQAQKDAVSKQASAQKNYDSAVSSLQRLEQDAKTAQKDAQESAEKALQTAKTQLSDAKNALIKAERNLEKAKKDFAESLEKSTNSYELQQENYQNAQKGSNSVRNAASSVKDAELILKEAQNKLEKTKIYAPLAGAVINLSKREGEKVSANNNANALTMMGTGGSSSAVVTVCDLSEIYLTAAVTEGDIVAVEADQTVRVKIDSIGEDVFPGKVVSISSLPSTDSSGITSYTVTVKLDGSPEQIKDGMAAELTFVRLEHTGVLKIPNKAVRLENGKQTVQVQNGDQIETREVQCGLTNGTESEVLSGLEAGEVLVYS